MSDQDVKSTPSPLFRFKKVYSSLKFFSRFDDWWFSKIPPLITVAILLILCREIEPRNAIPVTLGAFFSIISIAAYGHVVNDVFDIKSDALAGKPNTMALLPKTKQFLLCFLLFLSGFLPVFLCQFSLLAVALIFLNYLWPTLYSVPPIRFKERGFLGILLDAAGSHITPTVLILAVFAGIHPPKTDLPFLVLSAVIVTWAFVQGLKGILYHQLSDSENDQLSGTITWIRSIDRGRLRSFLPIFNLLVEMPVACILVWFVFPFCPIPSLALAIYIIAELLKNRMGFEFALNQDPENIRLSVPFANDLFYSCWLPLSVAVQISIKAPTWAWVPIVLTVCFLRDYRILLRDLKSTAKAVSRQVFR